MTPKPETYREIPRKETSSLIFIHEMFANSNLYETQRNKYMEMKSFNYLGVRHNVIIIVTKTTRAAHKLAENNVAKCISAPPIRVPPFDLLCLVPALLLHTIRKTPRVLIGAGDVSRDRKFLKESNVLSDHVPVEKRHSGIGILRPG